MEKTKDEKKLNDEIIEENEKEKTIEKQNEEGNEKQNVDNENNKTNMKEIEKINAATEKKAEKIDIKKEEVKIKTEKIKIENKSTEIKALSSVSTENEKKEEKQTKKSTTIKKENDTEKKEQTMDEIMLFRLFEEIDPINSRSNRKNLALNQSNEEGQKFKIKETRPYIKEKSKNILPEEHVYGSLCPCLDIIKENKEKGIDLDIQWPRQEKVVPPGEARERKKEYRPNFTRGRGRRGRGRGRRGRGRGRGRGRRRGYKRGQYNNSESDSEDYRRGGRKRSRRNYREKTRSSSPMAYESPKKNKDEDIEYF